MTFADLLGSHRVVPVVVLDEVEGVDGLGRALVTGGLPVAEVTLRSQGASSVLEALAARGDLLVGAGTVVSAEQVDLAADAGARFVVSPGVSASVVRRCQERDVPVVPGVSTATEIIAALDLGLDTVKLFPAEACGGLRTLAALAGAFPQVRFLPTGGITADLAPSYLAHPAVAAVGGSWMVAPGLLRDRRWSEVADLCAETVSAIAAPLGDLAGAGA